MRLLFIGGTGTISAAASRLAVEAGHDLYLLNRGARGAAPRGAHTLTADARRIEEARAALRGLRFDAVVNWIGYAPEDVERDLELLRGRTRQYLFISSASVYRKPPAHYVVTEETPLDNPFWDYARQKIACEERLRRALRDEGFPATVVRPSHTYDTSFPVAVMSGGTYAVAERMKEGRPVVVHGDGSSLWVVTHAEDFARGLLGLVGDERAVGQAFHITSDEVLTWNQVYETIAEALGVEANLVHIPSDFIARAAPERAGSLLGDKTWSVVFDNGKIRQFVQGFRAAITFREGIRQTLRWFDADARRRRVDSAAHEPAERILKAYDGRR